MVESNPNREANVNDLSAQIRAICSVDTDAPAIEFNGKWSSWGDFRSIMDGLDKLLSDYQLPKGTRVGALLRNDPKIGAGLAGIILSERCVVTLNPMLPDEKLVADINSLELPVIVGLPEDWEREAVRAAAEKAGILAVCLDDSPNEPFRILFDTREEGRDWRLDVGVCIEMLTSGTTGKPKRIPLKYKNFSQMVIDAASYENRTPDEVPRLRKGVTILNIPFSHIGGIFGLFLTLSAGRKICLLKRFEVEAFVDAVSRHKPKAVSAPPAGLRMILDANVPKSKFESLVVFRTGTAPLDPDLADEFYDRYGVPVLQNYGATEFAGGVAGWQFRDFEKFGRSKRGSVGRMNPGIEAKIVSEDSGEEVPVNEVGILQLRAKNLGDGKSWMRTTDLARMDEDGFLWIIGRADNAIIRGGFKVFPEDIVKAIENHPAVKEACVVALPDARLGSVPAAGYLLKSGESLSPDVLRDFLKDSLAAYQLPAKLVVLDEFPRTPSMKVSQPALKELLNA